MNSWTKPKLPKIQMAHERDHFLLINHNLIDKFLFIYLLKYHRQGFHKLKLGNAKESERKK